MTLRRTVAAVLAALALTSCGSAGPVAPAPTPAADGWSGSWATSPTIADPAQAGGVSDVTLQQRVVLSVGGSSMRLRLTNVFGTDPLVVAGTTLSPGAGGPSVPVTFGGSPSVTLDPGAEVASDPVALTVADRADVLVTTYLPGPTGPLTQHPSADVTTGLARGDARDGGRFEPVSTSWYLLAGLDVPAAGTDGAVVALGDSITDGTGSTPNSTRRWPDGLAARLDAAGETLGVLNAGIAGNQLLADGGTAGPSVLDRLDRDALDEPGVRTVVLLIGINDIVRSGGAIDPAELVAGYRTVAERVHAAGARLVLGTLTPIGSYPGATPAMEQVREAVNTWVRTGSPGVADAVVDFDAAVRDPADPTRLTPSFDSGDGLHPGDAGYAAMAAALDLATLVG